MHEGTCAETHIRYTRYTDAGGEAHFAEDRREAHARYASVSVMPVATGNTWTAATSRRPARASACFNRKCVMRVISDEPAACTLPLPSIPTQAESGPASRVHGGML